MIDKRLEEQRIRQSYEIEKIDANKIMDLLLLTKYENMTNRGRDYLFCERLKYDIKQIRNIATKQPSVEYYDLVNTVINKYESLIPNILNIDNKLALIKASVDAIEIVMKEINRIYINLKIFFLKNLTTR